MVASRTEACATRDADVAAPSYIYASFRRFGRCRIAGVLTPDYVDVLT